MSNSRLMRQSLFAFLLFVFISSIAPAKTESAEESYERLMLAHPKQKLVFQSLLAIQNWTLPLPAGPRIGFPL
jgi:hypothetical protein